MSHEHVNEILKMAAMGDGSGPPGGVGRGMGPGGGKKDGSGLGKGSQAPRAQAVERFAMKDALNLGETPSTGGYAGEAIGSPAIGLLALSHILSKVDPTGEKTEQVMAMSPAVEEGEQPAQGVQ